MILMKVSFFLTLQKKNIFINYHFMLFLKLVNPPVTGAIEEEEPEGVCENEQEEMHQIEPGDVKPICKYSFTQSKRYILTYIFLYLHI